MYGVMSKTYDKSCNYDYVLCGNYIIDFRVNIGAVLGPVLFPLVLVVVTTTKHKVQ